MDLILKSLEIIKNNQHSSGAFPAAPEYKPYQYCWLRDGTFTAYALDLAGDYEAADKFYRWCTAVLKNHFFKITRLDKLQNEGVKPEHNDFLHTRYTLAGEEGEEPWGNFQLDGYGIYLWGLSFHAEKCQIEKETKETARFIADYLSTYWQTPCLDCWEENGENIHPSTLAAIFGGLFAVQKLLARDFSSTLRAIKAFLQQYFLVDNCFRKFVNSKMVDASLLWLAVPFNVFDCRDPRIVNTAAAIENDLLTGGLHRYQGDSYYGGGEWLLLTAWLSWYYFTMAEETKADTLLQWVERKADAEGLLPEQVPEHLFVPESYPIWVEKWGQIAKPLLWSHAMYLIVKLNTKYLSKNSCNWF